MNPRKRKQAARAVMAWGGFCDGKLHMAYDTTGMVQPAIYRLREDARGQYEDVRRVRIVPGPVRGRGGGKK